VLELVLPIEPIEPPRIIVAVVRVIARAFISVSVVVKVPKGSMIGTMLSATLETVLVGTFVRAGQLVMELIVRVITAVFIVVSKCGYDRCTQHQNSCRY
jgi:hypothetical protein